MDDNLASNDSALTFTRDKVTHSTITSREQANSGYNNVRNPKDSETLSRGGKRFPRIAVRVLREWFEAHADCPYPTEKENANLEAKTTLSSNQIANWLANARWRQQARRKPRLRPGASPRLGPASTIPIPIIGTAWEDLNPLERWRHSPPENDPASIADIANAVAINAVQDELPSTLYRSSKSRKGSSSRSQWSRSNAPSATSAQSGQYSSVSASSAAALPGTSSHSSHGSFVSFRIGVADKKRSQKLNRSDASHPTHRRGLFGSFRSTPAIKKNARRHRNSNTVITTALDARAVQRRIFQCTFCTDTFKSKHDWVRHEKSLHLSLEKVCVTIVDKRLILKYASGSALL
jgi:hypothetical protein